MFFGITCSGERRVLARARRTQELILAIVPVAVRPAFCGLLGAGAPARSRRGDAGLGRAPRPAAGLAYELPDSRTESGVLGGETFSGLSRAMFVLSKAAVLLPVLAIADALIWLFRGSPAGCRPGSPRRTWPCCSPRPSGLPPRSRCRCSRPDADLPRQPPREAPGLVERGLAGVAAARRSLRRQSH